MKKLLLLTLLGLSINAASAATTVMCHFNSFNIPHSDRPQPVTSTHNVTIINTGGENKKYTLTYQMYINKQLVKVENYDYTVKGGGRLDDQRTMYAFVTFAKKQNYDASCRTTISGAENNQINGGGHIIIM